MIAATLAIKSLMTWVAILVLAFVNGGLREALLFKWMSRASAFVMSGLLLIACILAVAVLLMPWVGARSLEQCAVVGATWLVLTHVFEFCLGLAQGKRLSVILDAYRFREGNIWPLVLVVVAIAPAAGAYLRGILPASAS